MSRPRNPAATASLISATIASGVVGIRDHPLINGADEFRMSIDSKADAPLRYPSLIGLQRRGQKGVRDVIGKGKQQMVDVLGWNAMFQERVVNGISEW